MSATTTMPNSPAASDASESAPLRVLIADKFETAGVAALEARGFAVVVDPDLSPETLPAAIANLKPQVLVVRSTKVKADAINASESLELIVRAGAGYDNIDVAAASRRGILVSNCPGKNAIAVAELAWALILSCDRRLPDQAAELRAGTWNKKEYQKAQGLAGRTLGLVGFWQIAREVAKRAKAFGMPVVAWSRNLTEAQAAEAGVGCELVYLGTPGLKHATVPDYLIEVLMKKPGRGSRRAAPARRADGHSVAAGAREARTRYADGDERA